MRRDLISDGYDAALSILLDEYPGGRVAGYATGTQVGDWIIPPKWTLNGAYIEFDIYDRIELNESLAVMSYSSPMNETITFKRLCEITHTRTQMPDAIPYEFSFYDRKPGICLPYRLVKDLKPYPDTPPSVRVCIDSTFSDWMLKVGSWLVEGDGLDTIVLVAHLDHPFQANDGLSGVIVGLEVMRELAKTPRRYNYQMLVLPETIGSIAWLSNSREINYIGGVFLEMLGNRNTLAMTRTLHGDTLLDRIAARHTARQSAFHTMATNDEMVWNNPTVGVPMISLQRFPYREYHTSADNASIIDAAMLDEAKSKVLAIIDDLERGTNVPLPQWSGVPMLSRHGLWVDWRENAELNAALDAILSHIDGKRTVFEIADRAGLPVKSTSDWLLKLSAKGLLKWS
jgi:aminopeptidase-like protein